MSAAADCPAESPALFDDARFKSFQMLRSILEGLIEDSKKSDGFVYRVAMWHVMYRMLQHFEDCVEPENLEAMRLHRSLISLLIGIGEGLLGEADSAGKLNMEGCGFSRQQIEAYLTRLNEKLFTWHSGMTSERKAEVLEELFSAEA